MNLIRKFTNWTLVSSLIRAIYWTSCYIKDWRLVEESLHGDGFRSLLKHYLKMDSRIDWLGRVYGVVNPAINEKGDFDYNGMVFELNGVNTNNQTWVENWLYKQMILVNNIFDVQKTGFFDIIDANVKHVGPENLSSISAGNALSTTKTKRYKSRCIPTRRKFPSIKTANWLKQSKVSTFLRLI